MSQEQEVIEQEAWSSLWCQTRSKEAGSHSKAQRDSQDSSRNSGALSYLPSASDRNLGNDVKSTFPDLRMSIAPLDTHFKELVL